ncbi:MAG: serine/threonine protein kinase [Planctomycetes bacterium]|nr:serine/threonine protein kinase [Planctomycetota bacterium]
MPEETQKKSARRTERVGKYEIVDHLATGGMGIIYKARDPDLDRFVALKILPVEFAKQKTTLIRFEREAKAAAQLRHENIVAIYDVGEDHGTHFIALEFVDGADLQDYINRQCLLDPEEARQIIIQATRALGHAHEQGIVHRDVKPSNLLLTQKEGQLLVKLTDFGLAIRQENDEEFRITRDKTTVGTVDYMSPEQARDSRSADTRSDIYSLGCTFFHMLTGTAPFARGSLPERIVQHMQAQAPDVRRLNKAVPESLAVIIHRMLEKDPQDRYQTPAELLHALENPGEVAVPAGKNSVSAKLVRAPGQKRANDPTQILPHDVDVDDDADDPPRQVKATKPRRVAPPTEKKRKDTDPEIPTPRGKEPEERRPAKKTAEERPPADEKPKKKPAPSSPTWMYATGGVVGVLGLVLIGALIFGGNSSPRKKSPEPAPQPGPPPFVENPDAKKEKKPDPILDTSAKLMGAGEWPLARMEAAVNSVERHKLLKEYRGPFTTFPEAPKDAIVMRVRRLGPSGPGDFRTLADAFAATKSGTFTVIEIHDNGPICVSMLPAVAKRTIFVRGAAGHRPAIVWDGPGKGPFTFCAISDGTLILENLDLVKRWSAKGPATVFDLLDTDFYSRDCTFSLDASSPDTVALIRRLGSNRKEPTRTWLQHSYVRGAQATVIHSRDAPMDVILEESLIAGHEAPLFQINGREEHAFGLYCVRSTLVAGQTLLRWQTPGGESDFSPPLKGRILDSILSRDDTLAPAGDMLHLGNSRQLTLTSWRARNSVYAGWKQLLVSRRKNIAGTDLESWHAHWLYSSGDRALPNTWPINPPSGLDGQPATTFRPDDAPVAFAALSGSGAIGCVIGRLPPAPEFRLETTPLISGVSLEAPEINRTEDGYYHGERLDLNKVDLGAHLDTVLKTRKPAPRVVLRLTGRGACPTSPVRVKGIKHLILYFEPNPAPGGQIILQANETVIEQQAPIVAMTDGHLELIGARIVLADGSRVPSLIRLLGADLTLTRSWLQGPLFRITGGFQSLIAASNAAETPITLLLRDNVLLAGRLLLDLQERVQLKAHNNAFVSLDDAVRFDPGERGGPGIHVLDHNTWAVRKNCFTLGTEPASETAQATVVHVRSNVFLGPFDDADARPTLVRGAETWAAKGLWRWRGGHNVYDARLFAFFAPAKSDPHARQKLSDWAQAWGQAGEQNPVLYQPGAAVKAMPLENVSAKTLLRVLTLPKQIRGDPTQAPPGADAASLLKGGK